MEKDNKKKFSFKDIIAKIVKLIKKLNKKTWIIIGAVFLVLVVLLILMLTVFNKNNKFALDGIYDVYPEDVRNLYKNVVSVSCTGDLKVNIEIDKGSTNVLEMDRKDLLNYVFSYLDKNNLLTDKIKPSVITDASKKLFEEKINLLNDINNFQYSNFVYTFDGSNIVRTKKDCVAGETSHITHLFGYYVDDNHLYVDMSVGYLKNGVLYNYKDKELGKYSGNKTELPDLMENTSYYRFSYKKDRDEFKLEAVEWKNRT